ncbi:MAG TPA: CD225/dispanin family protein [Thermoanaerobaculia bacterium]|nr:CD225/dispanin family protein [Thermoanaerobaculia bacterium]
MGGGAPMTPGEKIPNYLIQSIIVTLCCCLPLGIVGLIFGSQVNSKLAQGDVAGAREASKKAKQFLLIGVGIWAVLFVIGLLMNGAVFLEALRDSAANR